MRQNQMNQWWSLPAIAMEVSKLRIRQAEKKRNTCRFRKKNLPSTSDGAKPWIDLIQDASIPGELLAMTPPRKEWLRPREEYRKHHSAHAVRYKSVYDCIMMHYRCGTLDNQLWGDQLLSFVDALQSSVVRGRGFGSGFRFVSLPKVKPHNGEKSFRFISRPGNLKDMVLLGLANRYLSQAIDPFLCASVYSYRKRNVGYSHHTAVARLVRYCRLNQGAQLWFADNDIFRFFDSCKHETVLNQLNEFDMTVGEKGQRLDKAFKVLIENMFSNLRASSRVALNEGVSRQHRRGIHALANFHEDSLIRIANGIGLPVGTSLASSLSNLMLLQVDKAVNNALGGEGIYLRFADDTIIVTTDRDKLKNANSAYGKAIESLDLRQHNPVSVPDDAQQSGTKKWGAKWASPTSQPWVTFLGYDIRYDGLLKISQQAVEREIAFQDAFFRKVFKMVGALTTEDIRPKGEPNLVRRVRYYFVLRITGSMNGGTRSKHRFAWANGYRLLARFPHSNTGLKALDRNLEKNMSRLSDLVNTKLSERGVARIVDSIIPKCSYYKPFARTDLALNLAADTSKLAYTNASESDISKKRSLEPDLSFLKKLMGPPDRPRSGYIDFSVSGPVSCPYCFESPCSCSVDISGGDW